MTLYSKQDAKEAAQGFGALAAIVAAFVLLCLGIGTLVWWLSVGTSGIKGKGDVVRKNNSGTNQVEAQATFTALYGDLQSYKTKIVQAAKDQAANPGQAFYAQVLTGLESTCSDAAQQYNADAADTTMKDWRPSDLPAAIDPADYCEATR